MIRKALLVILLSVVSISAFASQSYVCNSSYGDYSCYPTGKFNTDSPITVSCTSRYSSVVNNINFFSMGYRSNGFNCETTVPSPGQRSFECSPSRQAIVLQSVTCLPQTYRIHNITSADIVSKMSKIKFAAASYGVITIPKYTVDALTNGESNNICAIHVDSAGSIPSGGIINNRNQRTGPYCTFTQDGTILVTNQLRSQVVNKVSNRGNPNLNYTAQLRDSSGKTTYSSVTGYNQSSQVVSLPREPSSNELSGYLVMTISGAQPELLKVCDINLEGDGIYTVTKNSITANYSCSLQDDPNGVQILTMINIQ